MLGLMLVENEDNGRELIEIKGEKYKFFYGMSSVTGIKKTFIVLQNIGQAMA